MHPNTDWEANRQTEWKAIFTETGYKDNAWTYLSWIEYWDEVTQIKKEAYILANPDFKFKLMSEAQANKLLEDYGFDENWNQLVTVKDFVFTDNRLEEI